jgi:hypothetical protein
MFYIIFSLPKIVYKLSRVQVPVNAKFYLKKSKIKKDERKLRLRQLFENTV